MRAIIFSDSHGEDSTLRWMLEETWKTVGPVDYYIHCGDGAYDFERLESFIRRRDEHACCLGVGGNCDYGVPGLPETRVLNVGGVRVLITHGHRFKVKMTYTFLDKAAQEMGCSIAFFGHTHIPCMEQHRTLLVNPGSAARGHMALMEVTDGKPRVELLTY